MRCLLPALSLMSWIAWTPTVRAGPPADPDDSASPPASEPHDIADPIDLEPLEVERPQTRPPVEQVLAPAEHGPPWATDAEIQAVRDRYQLTDAPRRGRKGTAIPTASERASERRERALAVKRKFHCLLADPTCGTTFELQATSAFAQRLQQGDVSQARDLRAWASAVVEYAGWLGFPVVREPIRGRQITTVTFGPKGGVLASDRGDLWGNAGFAMRVWLGHHSNALSVEISSAMSFTLRGVHGPTQELRPLRSPPGLIADVGLGFGGWGAIVIGGQFSPPLARADVPDVVRIPASGMIFIGFRGNIVWGGPAAIAVGTHAIASRAVTRP